MPQDTEGMFGWRLGAILPGCAATWSAFGCSPQYQPGTGSSFLHQATKFDWLGCFVQLPELMRINDEDYLIDYNTI